MGVDCQFCGTAVSIPESGALLFDLPSLFDRDVAVSSAALSEMKNSKVITYETKTQLQNVLKSLITKKEPEEWIYVLDASAHIFPITLRHLFERLEHPELAEIIHQSDFTSYFQPILDMKSNSIFGYEALLRTSYKDIDPGMLFSFAHRSGLHSMLDQKARRTAVKKKAQYLSEGQKMFINFLPSTIYVPEFCLQHTFQIVKEFNVNPEDLVFEVVESEKITDVPHLKSILDTYQASGMKVALDDVGTGYSTLDMLSLIQPDILKIDRSYVRNCNQDEANQKFLYNVMDRAQTLNIKVLAEGIETMEEWNWLKAHDIDYGQGYFIGKPKPYPQDKLIHP
ncbi:EAL domain-containing protein [Halobacillus salinarum]|uniref:EAL domain-containing protein n=1 Tax=Halobacillus salinarum TaxID=2932257 RepID=A0ABY4EVB8_9BACI|nr:EAL domain-containing protein [Halobacillus salinarum]UOQ46106.1 EAL domain-containing protein [Halobacillus salinarum]